MKISDWHSAALDCAEIDDYTLYSDEVQPYLVADCVSYEPISAKIVDVTDSIITDPMTGKMVADPCYCNEDQGAGYTYDDEYGPCNFCLKSDRR